jgi:hypothetical protein
MSLMIAISNPYISNVSVGDELGVALREARQKWSGNRLSSGSASKSAKITRERHNRGSSRLRIGKNEVRTGTYFLLWTKTKRVRSFHLMIARKWHAALKEALCWCKSAR